MMRTVILLAILGCVFQSSYAQYRYADIELKLISHEQYMFIKGPYESVLEFKVTNLGPDTIKQKDTFAFVGRSSYLTGNELPEYDYFGLEYDLPPGVSFLYQWPITIDLSQDFRGHLHKFGLGVFTRNKIGDPLSSEMQILNDLNSVLWYIHYRSATSSTAELDASKLNIWPNPARDEVHLTLPEGWESTNCAVSMHSIQGDLLQSLPLSPNVSISVAHLPAGMYVLEVRNAEAVVRKKLMLLR